jgi:hypothetical protein
MKKTNLINALMFLLTLPSLAQSPWTREKNKGYVQVGFSSLQYNEFQSDGEKVDLSADVSDFTVQAYAEYGITKKLEAQLIVPFKSVTVESKVNSNSESLSGLGNISLGLKYKLYDEKWKISSGVLYSANSIKRDAEIGLTTGFNAATFVPYISVGSSTGKWYYYGTIGYGYMTKDFSDFFKATFEVGYEVIKNGHLMFLIDTKNVVSKEDAFDKNPFQWPSYLDRQTYNALGIKGNYEFKKDTYGANFAFIGATGIDNAPLAPTLNFGVYTKF